MENYYQKHFLQVMATVPTGYPAPSDTKQAWSDGKIVKGRFIVDDSTRALIAMAQGVRTFGRFACDIDTALKPGDILRRESDGAYIRISGDSKDAPAQAESQIKVFAAQIVDGVE